ncbi:hypothetical protein V5799_017473 [Amblyomma americanum]|uniref:Uncharacterized protein n=1 Tax=Amblyomma americanum TaxID=6943 RepID=A0AAQ4F210_AMBAM
MQKRNGCAQGFMRRDGSGLPGIARRHLDDLDASLPLLCTGTEHTDCQITVHLSKLNEFFWNARLELRKLSSTLANLSLVRIYEQCLPLPNWSQIRTGAALAHRILKNHSCVAALDINTGSFKESETLLREALRNNASIKSFKIHFHGFVSLEDDHNLVSVTMDGCELSGVQLAIDLFVARDTAQRNADAIAWASDYVIGAVYDSIEDHYNIVCVTMDGCELSGVQLAIDLFVARDTAQRNADVIAWASDYVIGAVYDSLEDEHNLVSVTMDGCELSGVQLAIDLFVARDTAQRNADAIAWASDYVIGAVYDSIEDHYYIVSVTMYRCKLSGVQLAIDLFVARDTAQRNADVVAWTSDYVIGAVYDSIEDHYNIVSVTVDGCELSGVQLAIDLIVARDTAQRNADVVAWTSDYVIGAVYDSIEDHYNIVSVTVDGCELSGVQLAIDLIVAHDTAQRNADVVAWTSDYVIGAVYDSIEDHYNIVSVTVDGCELSGVQLAIDLFVARDTAQRNADVVAWTSDYVIGAVYDSIEDHYNIVSVTVDGCELSGVQLAIDLIVARDTAKRNADVVAWTSDYVIGAVYDSIEDHYNIVSVTVDGCELSGVQLAIDLIVARDTAQRNADVVAWTSDYVIGAVYDSIEDHYNIVSVTVDGCELSGVQLAIDLIVARDTAQRNADVVAWTSDYVIGAVYDSIEDHYNIVSVTVDGCELSGVQLAIDLIVARDTAQRNADVVAWTSDYVIGAVYDSIEDHYNIVSVTVDGCELSGVQLAIDLFVARDTAQRNADVVAWASDYVIGAVYDSIEDHYNIVSVTVDGCELSGVQLAIDLIVARDTAQRNADVVAWTSDYVIGAVYDSIEDHYNIVSVTVDGCELSGVQLAIDLIVARDTAQRNADVVAWTSDYVIGAVYDSIEDHYNIVSVTVDGCELSGVQLAIDLIVARDTAQRNADVVAWTSDYVIGAVYDSIEDHYNIVSVTVDGCELSGVQLAIDLFVARDTAQRNADVVAWTSDYVIGAVYDSIEDHYNIVSVTVDGCELSGVQLAIDLIVARDTAQRNADVVAWTSDYVIGAVYDSIEDHYNIFSVTVDGCELSGVQLAIDLFVALDTAQRNAHVVAWTSDYVIGAVYDSVTTDGCELSGVQLAIDLFVIRDTAQRNAEGVVWATDYVIGAVYDSIEDHYNIVSVTVDGCELSGVQLAIDLIVARDTAQRNADVVAWTSDYVIGAVYDSIEDHYNIVSMTVDGCELSGVQLAIDLFVARDTTQRNADVVAWASDYVIGAVYDSIEDHYNIVSVTVDGCELSGVQLAIDVFDARDTAQRNADVVAWTSDYVIGAVYDSIEDHYNIVSVTVDGCELSGVQLAIDLFVARDTTQRNADVVAWASDYVIGAVYVSIEDHYNIVSVTVDGCKLSGVQLAIDLFVARDTAQRNADVVAWASDYVIGAVYDSIEDHYNIVSVTVDGCELSGVQLAIDLIVARDTAQRNADVVAWTSDYVIGAVYDSIEDHYNIVSVTVDGCELSGVQLAIDLIVARDTAQRNADVVAWTSDYVIGAVYDSIEDHCNIVSVTVDGCELSGVQLAIDLIVARDTAQRNADVVAWTSDYVIGAVYDSIEDHYNIVSVTVDGCELSGVQLAIDLFVARDTAQRNADVVAWTSDYVIGAVYDSIEDHYNIVSVTVDGCELSGVQLAIDLIVARDTAQRNADVVAWTSDYVIGAVYDSMEDHYNIFSVTVDGCELSGVQLAIDLFVARDTAKRNAHVVAWTSDYVIGAVYDSVTMDGCELSGVQLAIDLFVIRDTAQRNAEGVVWATDYVIGAVYDSIEDHYNIVSVTVDGCELSRVQLAIDLIVARDTAQRNADVVAWASDYVIGAVYDSIEDHYNIVSVTVDGCELSGVQLVIDLFVARDTTQRNADVVAWASDYVIGAVYVSIEDHYNIVSVTVDGYELSGVQLAIDLIVARDTAQRNADVVAWTSDYVIGAVYDSIEDHYNIVSVTVDGCELSGVQLAIDLIVARDTAQRNADVVAWTSDYVIGAVYDSIEDHYNIVSVTVDGCELSGVQLAIDLFVARDTAQRNADVVAWTSDYVIGAVYDSIEDHYNIVSVTVDGCELSGVQLAIDLFVARDTAQRNADVVAWTSDYVIGAVYDSIEDHYNIVSVTVDGCELSGVQLAIDLFVARDTAQRNADVVAWTSDYVIGAVYDSIEDHYNIVSVTVDGCELSGVQLAIDLIVARDTAQRNADVVAWTSDYVIGAVYDSIEDHYNIVSVTVDGCELSGVQLAIDLFVARDTAQRNADVVAWTSDYVIGAVYDSIEDHYNIVSVTVDGCELSGVQLAIDLFVARDTAQRNADVVAWTSDYVIGAVYDSIEDHYNIVSVTVDGCELSGVQLAIDLFVARDTAQRNADVVAWTSDYVIGAVYDSIEDHYNIVSVTVDGCELSGVQLAIDLFVARDTAQRNADVVAWTSDYVIGAVYDSIEDHYNIVSVTVDGCELSGVQLAIDLFVARDTAQRNADVVAWASDYVIGAVYVSIEDHYNMVSVTVDGCKLSGVQLAIDLFVARDTAQRNADVVAWASDYVIGAVYDSIEDHYNIVSVTVDGCDLSGVHLAIDLFVARDTAQRNADVVAWASDYVIGAVYVSIEDHYNIVSVTVDGCKLSGVQLAIDLFVARDTARRNADVVAWASDYVIGAVYDSIEDHYNIVSVTVDGCELSGVQLAIDLFVARDTAQRNADVVAWASDYVIGAVYDSIEDHYNIVSVTVDGCDLSGVHLAIDLFVARDTAQRNADVVAWASDHVIGAVYDSIEDHYNIVSVTVDGCELSGVQLAIDLFVARDTAQRNADVVAWTSDYVIGAVYDSIKDHYNIVSVTVDGCELSGVQLAIDLFVARDTAQRNADVVAWTSDYVIGAVYDSIEDHYNIFSVTVDGCELSGVQLAIDLFVARDTAQRNAHVVAWTSDYVIGAVYDSVTMDGCELSGVQLAIDLFVIRDTAQRNAEGVVWATDYVIGAVYVSIEDHYNIVSVTVDGCELSGVQLAIDFFVARDTTQRNADVVAWASDYVIGAVYDSIEDHYNIVSVTVDGCELSGVQLAIDLFVARDTAQRNADVVAWASDYVIGAVYVSIEDHYNIVSVTVDGCKLSGVQLAIDLFVARDTAQRNADVVAWASDYVIGAVYDSIEDHYNIVSVTVDGCELSGVQLAIDLFVARDTAQQNADVVAWASDYVIGAVYDSIEDDHNMVSVTVDGCELSGVQLAIDLFVARDTAQRNADAVAWASDYVIGAVYDSIEDHYNIVSVTVDGCELSGVQLAIDLFVARDTAQRNADVVAWASDYVIGAVYDSLEDDHNLVSVTMDGCELSGVQLAIDLFVARDTAQRNADAIAWASDYVIGAVYDSIEDHYYIVSVTMYRCKLSGVQLAIDLFVARDTAQRNADVIAWASDYVIGAVYDSIEDHYNIVSVTVDGCELSGVQLAIDLFVARDTAQRNADVVAWTSDYVIGAVYDSIEDHYNIVSVTVDGCELSGVQLAIDLFVARDTAQRNADVVAWASDYVIGAVYDSVTMDGCELSGVQLAIDLFVIRDTAQRNAEGVVWATDYVIGAVYDSIEDHYNIVSVTVDGCELSGVQLAIDLFVARDTAQRNADVVAWTSDYVIGAVYDSIEDHYNIVSVTVDGCELSGVQLAIDLFVARDTAQRNADVVAWASDYVIGAVYDSVTVDGCELRGVQLAIDLFVARDTAQRNADAIAWASDYVIGAVYDSIEDHYNIVSVTVDGCELSGVQLAIDLFVARDTAQRNADVIAWASDYVIGAVYDSIEDHYNIVSVTVDGCELSGMQLAIDLFVARDTAQRNADVIAWASDYVIGAVYDSIEDHYNIVSVTVDGCELSGVQLAIDLFVARDTAQRNADAIAWASDYVIGAVYDSIEDHYNIVSVTVDGCELSGVQLAIDLFVARDTAQRNADVVAWASDYVIGAVYDSIDHYNIVSVTVDGCELSGVQLAIDLFVARDTAQRNADVVAWASDYVIGAVYDSIEDHYNIVSVTVDGCELSGVQLAIDLFVARDTAQRNADVIVWASDYVIGAVYDSIEDHYNIVSVTVDGCELSGVQLAIDLFVARDTAQRNADVIAWASDYVIGAVYDSIEDHYNIVSVTVDGCELSGVQLAIDLFVARDTAQRNADVVAWASDYVIGAVYDSIEDHYNIVSVTMDGCELSGVQLAIDLFVILDTAQRNAEGVVWATDYVIGAVYDSIEDHYNIVSVTMDGCELSGVQLAIILFVIRDTAQRNAEGVAWATDYVIGAV